MPVLLCALQKGGTRCSARKLRLLWEEDAYGAELEYAVQAGIQLILQIPRQSQYSKDFSIDHLKYCITIQYHVAHHYFHL